MVLAKITIKHEHSSSVMGVTAYHGLVCAVYSVRFLCREVRGLASPRTSLHSALVGV